MKRLARMFVWWPRLDHDIEQKVKGCHECQNCRPSPPLAMLIHWKWPSWPWSRLHINFVAPFKGHMFLVVIDAHSKRLEVHPMPTITAQPTIQRLRTIFAQFGLPEGVVPDNGPTFISWEFKNFLHQNGVEHVMSASCHPATNGLVERAVWTFKEGGKKLKEGDIRVHVHTKLARFLFSYRITLQSTTGVLPAELLMERRLRSALDLVKPDLHKRVEREQERQKAACDPHVHKEQF